MIVIDNQSVAFYAKSGIRLQSGIDSSYGGPDERQKDIAEGEEDVLVDGLVRHAPAKERIGEGNSKVLLEAAFLQLNSERCIMSAIEKLPSDGGASSAKVLNLTISADFNSLPSTCLNSLNVNGKSADKCPRGYKGPP